MRKGKIAFLVLLILSLTLFLSGCGLTNQSPNASFNADPASGTAPLEVTLNASSSSDPDGSVISYEWDFGDGSTGSGETTTHTYSNAGNYTIGLIVTEDDGATDTTVQSIEVSSPEASFTATPTSGEVPLVVTLDASDSTGDIESYEWDFDDGTTGSGKTITHTYEDPDSYRARLTVTYESGGNGYDSKEIIVSPSEPPTPG